MRRILCAALLLVTYPVLVAQQRIDNGAVVKMVKAGLSDDIIVTTINASPGAYDTSPDALIALKGSGVSDKVISAIVAKSSVVAQTPGVSQGAAVAAKDAAVQPPPAPAGDESSLEPGTARGMEKVPAGARIVIAPMGGFETYFAAAVREKKVPVTLTLDKATAQYFVVSTDTEWQGFVFGSGGAANWNRDGGSAAYGSSASSTRGLEASIMLIDAKTKDVVWAYEVHKSSHGSLFFGTLGARGKQSVAEACAKHLREYIEKGN